MLQIPAHSAKFSGATFVPGAERAFLLREHLGSFHLINAEGCESKKRGGIYLYAKLGIKVLERGIHANYSSEYGIG